MTDYDLKFFSWYNSGKNIIALFWLKMENFKCWRNVSKLQKTPNYYSLKKTGTSYEQELVSTNNLR